MTQSSKTGWTIMIGTWNHLRKVWGPTKDTLAKIQASSKTQESLEEANVFSPTRHLLLVIKRLWQIDRVHGLPAVAAPVSFPSASKGDECWWGTQDLNTVFLWDTMDNEDRQSSLETLRATVRRTTGWCGKRRMTNGHRSYEGRAFTNYYLWIRGLLGQ
jgi:hypothetical protein